MINSPVLPGLKNDTQVHQNQLREPASHFTLPVGSICLSACLMPSGNLVQETVGRYEQPPTPRSAAMQAALGGQGAKAVMNHPQNDEHVRPALYYVHMPLHSASNDDLPAGRSKHQARRTNDSDLTILHHREYVPKPPPPPLLALHQTAYKQYVDELARVTQHDGLVGIAAHAAAVQAVYGSTAAVPGRPPRPPTAPKGMLVGTPRPAKQPSGWQPRTPRSTPPVPSHVVSGGASARERALRRSQSFDFVRRNKVAAASTPRTPSAVRAERESLWKLRRFERVQSRVLSRPSSAAGLHS
jgi:hypothetical protein